MDTESTNFQKFEKNTSDKNTILQFYHETAKKQNFQMQKTVLNYLKNEQSYKFWKKRRLISLVLYKMIYSGHIFYFKKILNITISKKLNLFQNCYIDM